MLRVLLLLVLLLLPVSASGQAVCSHWAAPGGSGTTCTQSAPCQVASWWPLAGPGKTLCLQDGEYRGDAQMLRPPAHLHGTEAQPITVRAEHDGKVLLHGQGARLPVLLQHNDWWELQGFNACCSSGSVVSIDSGADHVSVRRVVGWHAHDSNTQIFGAHYNAYTLFEDVAGFGIARKIFSNSQGGNDATIRRAWASWDGSHWLGPKHAYTLAYNNYRQRFENILGTWSGRLQKETYTLGCPEGDSYWLCGSTMTNYQVDQPFGVLSLDRLDGSSNADSTVQGALMYFLPGARVDPKMGAALRLGYENAMTLTGTVAVAAPGMATSTPTLSLQPAKQPGGPLTARQITGIAGKGVEVVGGWTTSEVRDLPAPPAGGTLWSEHPDLCYRVVDGVRTTTPLWPWPMQQRITDATVQAGSPVVDVQAQVESVLGPIPAQCTSGAPPTPSDTTPPTVAITAPSQGALISGASVAVTAEATDNTAVVGVQWFINGQPKESEVSAPWGRNINTTTIPNGNYTITAEARDQANNRTMSPSITVTVFNGPTPPAPQPGTHPVLTCTGALGAEGALALRCEPEGGRR